MEIVKQEKSKVFIWKQDASLEACFVLSQQQHETRDSVPISNTQRDCIAKLSFWYCCWIPELAWYWWLSVFRHLRRPQHPNKLSKETGVAVQYHEVENSCWYLSEALIPIHILWVFAACQYQSHRILEWLKYWLRKCVTRYPMSICHSGSSDDDGRFKRIQTR